MPEIKVNYSLRKEEAVETILSITKEARKKRFISICIISVFGILLTCMISGEIYSIFLFGLIALAFPGVSLFLMKRHTGKSYDETNIGKLGVELRFFRDHVEKIICKGEGRRSREEIHYPFEAVKMVFESENMYIFFISSNDIVQLPKRSLAEEDNQKIKNLIGHLFKYNFKKV